MSLPSISDTVLYIAE